MRRALLPEITTLVLLSATSVFVACTRINGVINPVGQQPVDAFISSALSVHDRNVIRNVMLLLRPSQWENVVFI